MLSSIEHLHRKLHKRWVPKWFDAFCDNENGGFHERLGRAFKAVDADHKRLVTQCRQIAVYSHASGVTKGARNIGSKLTAKLDFLIDKYLTSTPGAWRFSIAYNGDPKDNTLDLYGHAFVIFTLCHVHNGLGDDRARTLASDTLDFITTSFRLDNAPGFAEALAPDMTPLPKIRRQDPHMHLLEACLFAYDTWQDKRYLNLADELIDLFLIYFVTAPDNDLIEYFDSHLQPHPQDGHRVKPGHYFEWVWLIKKYQKVSRNHAAKLDKICRHFLIKGNACGWDDVHGGIYDYTDHKGHVIEDTKRLWPFAEALKANALMLDDWDDRDELKDRMAEMVHVFENGYIDERGFWTETLNRDLTAATDFMPGTTPYHLYFGIEETLAYLRSRGKSKSLKSIPLGIIYSLRRHASNMVQLIFKPLN